MAKLSSFRERVLDPANRRSTNIEDRRPQQAEDTVKSFEAMLADFASGGATDAPDDDLVSSLTRARDEGYVDADRADGLLSQYNEYRQGVTIEEAPLSPDEQDAMDDAAYAAPSGDFLPFAGLPDDAPGDDRVDRALMERARKNENSTALEWLLSGDMDAFKSFASGLPDDVVSPERKQLIQQSGDVGPLTPDTAKAFARDVAGGVIEAPMQVMGGARDAAQAALNGIDALGDTLAYYASQFGLEDPERAAELAAERNVPLLPEIRDPNSVSGGVVRGIAQFVEAPEGGGAGGGSGDDTRYTIELFGGCLGEFLPDGARVVADSHEPIKPLDLCSVAIRDGSGPWARFIRSCGEDFSAAVKIYLGRFEGRQGAFYFVGQIAPPVVSLIPESEIKSLHKIVGTPGGASMTATDREAFALIAPLARAYKGGPIEAINRGA